MNRPKRRRTTDNLLDTGSPAVSRRWVAAILVAALVVSVVMSGGVLLATTQFDRVREQLAEYLGDLDAIEYGAFRPLGLGGVAVDDVHWKPQREDGVVLDLRIGRLVAYPRWSALAEGRWETARIVIESPDMEISGLDWDDSETSQFDRIEWDDLFESAAGPVPRIELKNGHVSIDRGVAKEPFRVEVADATIHRESEAAPVRVTANGHLFDARRSPFRIAGQALSAEDISLELGCETLDLGELAAAWIPDAPIEISGTVSPLITLRRTGGDSVRVTVSGKYTALNSGDLPPALQNLSGTASAQATFYPGTGALLIDTARADANRVGGAIAGGIDLAADPPWIDMRFEADRIPANDLLLTVLDEQLRTYGEFDISLDPATQMTMRLTGPVDIPRVRGQLRAPQGDFAFLPLDSEAPPFSVTLANFVGAWDNYQGDWDTRFDVVDGETYQADWDITAQRLRGTVRANPREVTVEGLTAVVNGEPVLGGMTYAMQEGEFDGWIDGRVSSLETTPFHDAIDDVALAGTVAFNARITSDGDALRAFGRFDANQAQVDYEWWFTKPIGVAGGGDFEIVFSPDELITVEFDGSTASSDLYAALDFVPHPAESRWWLQRAGLRSDRIDLRRLDRLLNLPYRFDGTEATQGYLDWWREAEGNGSVKHSRIGCYVDSLELLAEAPGAEPITLHGGTIELALENVPTKTAQMWLSVDDARMPPFGTTWAIAIVEPPEWRTSPERTWTYDLRAATLDAPPWRGADFRAEAYSTADESGLSTFSAAVDEGNISGYLKSVDAENKVEAAINWSGVSAAYFLEHLGYPNVLSGSSEGNISYSLDQDDPATLLGEGGFRVADGKFSVDYLYSMLLGAGVDPSLTLPPSLEFQKLDGDLRLAGDRVETSPLILDSKMLTVTGNGHFIHQGDMAYDLAIAIAPDTAETIPIIRDNFNVRGHQISGQPIELTFQVSGPTFNPQGRVAELPSARVTLMSGALEVGREAVNFIDFPRKVLVDLLRMGGGIVGAGNASREQRPPP